MYNAFFKARPRLRAALFGLAVCTPSLMIGVTAALAETPGAVAPAFASDRLSVEVVGRGPDVILIPGYGCSREVWRATADRLKATHRGHLVQLAGFAGQPWTHGDGPLLEPAVEALAAYVQTAGLQKPAVIGHSMGGLSALMLAQRHPEAVGRVMAVDNLPFFSALFGPQVTPETARPFADQAAQAMLSQDEAALRAAQEQGAIGLARDPATRTAMVDWTLASDRRALATAIHEVMTTDVRPGLAAMTTPVTVLYAADANGGAPAAMADALWGREYAALPGVKLIRVDDSRHFIMADQPQTFAQRVDQFLAD
ncbi:alpha/beta fold hydrolase [Brevundimonas aurantiaca]|uniref:alpha/beta fold hydrolase n=1 Tax=Brevundimonas aurantiaca TaxID=74316 RepID=UPI001748B6CC|nr:alpha/beta hydrolase [Brevundimonas aurantiaca]